MAINAQVCICRWLFLNHVKPWKSSTEPVELMNGIIEWCQTADYNSLGLSCGLCLFLSPTEDTVAIYWCLCPNKRFNWSLAAQPLSPPIPQLFSLLTLLYAIYIPVCTLSACMCICIYMYMLLCTLIMLSCSARNKVQKLVGHYFEDRIFIDYWLLSD